MSASFSLDNYKLSCELVGHSMDVRSVCGGAETDDGQQTVISGSRDLTTKLWKPLHDAVGYSESVSFKDHKNFVACVFYHERERWLCTGSNDATICIYREGSLLPQLTLQGHTATVCTLAAGLEPRSLISGSWDTTAHVWTVTEDGQGSSHHVMRGHAAAVWAVATLLESKRYITGSADHTICYWNAAGEKLRLLKGHNDCIRGLVPLKPNGTFVSCSNDATLRVWNEDGECIKELSGHNNYIYSLAQNRKLGEDCIVSCGEDSTLRMWDINTGEEKGKPMVHPTQSVWSVTCLRNGDIVTGGSDGIVRVFTQDPQRFAPAAMQAAFEKAVETRRAQLVEDLGGIKKTDLPGPESLLLNGTREGQTKMVRFPDGVIKCYSWELGKWNLIGDVTGASGSTQETSGKVLFEGREYDYVFSVDISDSAPPLKLPFNKGDDPWHAAQAFIHKHSLPQAYLDQVANFIIRNSTAAKSNSLGAPSNSSYQDPFTGENRYMPGTVENSSYSGGKDGKHYPVKTYYSFDLCNLPKILVKLTEFNAAQAENSLKINEEMLDAIKKLANHQNSDLLEQPETLQMACEGLNNLLKWPNEKLFPVIDIIRLAVRKEAIFVAMLDKLKFLDILMPLMSSTAANQLMIIRCFTNILGHNAGRQQLDKYCNTLMDNIRLIREGNGNLQTAIASFLLNVTITELMTTARDEMCRVTTETLIEFLQWANDMEATYRAMQAIGNLMTTTYAQGVVALVVSADPLIDKIRKLTEITPKTDELAKVNAISSALLSSF